MSISWHFKALEIDLNSLIKVGTRVLGGLEKK